MPKANSQSRSQYAPRGEVRIKVMLPTDVYEAVNGGAEVTGMTHSNCVARRVQDSLDRYYLLTKCEALFMKHLGEVQVL